MANDPTKPPQWYENNKDKAKEDFNRAAARDKARTRDDGGDPPSSAPAAHKPKSKFVKDMPGPIGSAARREQEIAREEERPPEPPTKTRRPRGHEPPSM